jgi:hypothetical protein
MTVRHAIEIRFLINNNKMRTVSGSAREREREREKATDEIPEG